MNKLSSLLLVVGFQVSNLEAQTSNELWTQVEKMQKAIIDIVTLIPTLPDKEVASAYHASSIACSIETSAQMLSGHRHGNPKEFTRLYTSHCTLTQRSIEFQRVYLSSLIQKSTSTSLNGELRSLRDSMDELSRMIAPAVKAAEDFLDSKKENKSEMKTQRKPSD